VHPVQSTEPFLRLTGVSKTYPGVTALDRVSLQVRRGEVIGLVGENGAGKSTLMKILGGVVAPSSGSIEVDGAPRSALTVAAAIAAGIAFVHQELSLFDNLDAASNAFIGREPLHGGLLKLVDRKKLHELARPHFDALAVDFRPDTLVSELSIAQRQLLEIAKALSLNSRLVIMDEPTSSLTLAETDRLMRVIADLKAKGVAIIFISHRLNELTECADRVVVLRDGAVVGELPKQQISHAAMIRMMIGRDLKALYLPPAAPPGDAVLEIDGVRTQAHPGQAVSLSLRRGEILGMAGLIGAGRTELARALFGMDRLLGGRLTLAGERVELTTPRDAIARGIFLVPEDRKRCGLLLDDTICENILLPYLANGAAGGDDPESSSSGKRTNRAFVQQRQAVDAAERQQQNLGIRAPSVHVETGTLSGGNQQKVVLGKWLAMSPRVLICDEPTRGVDVGAKSEIYRKLRDLADAGVAILMISSDMEEVIGVSDRIAVMHAGAISGFLERAEFSEHKILRLAVGDRSH
jgi:ribose transport system ATP-binding protein